MINESVLTGADGLIKPFIWITTEPGFVVTNDTASFRSI